MKSTSNLVVLVLVAATAVLAHANPSHAQVPHRPAINPQPLPPRHGGASVNDVINPQPLPPRHGVASARDAINPQPLPPRTVDMTSQGATPRASIGETERN